MKLSLVARETVELAIEKVTDKFKFQSLVARETVLPAIRKSWHCSDFAELRVVRHSGTSSAKRDLFASATGIIIALERMQDGPSEDVVQKGRVLWS